MRNAFLLSLCITRADGKWTGNATICGSDFHDGSVEAIAEKLLSFEAQGVLTAAEEYKAAIERAALEHMQVTLKVEAFADGTRVRFDANTTPSEALSVPELDHHCHPRALERESSNWPLRGGVSVDIHGGFCVYRD